MLVALFALYLALLAWLVLWKLHDPYVGDSDLRRIKLLPFAATDTAGASAAWEVIGNVLVFVPFGLVLRMLAPALPMWRVGAAAAATSIGFELAQFVLAVGVSDVTDVITNIAGAIVGAGLARLTARSHPGRVRAVTAVVVAIVAALVLLVLIADATGRGIPFSPRLAPGAAASAEAATTPSIDSCAC
ncbi:glycopeptide antibiotics resistance protein [Microbacterium terrae]|uniref:VanZ like family protein n=1 Tax=Microbacterium terrae TaxID=69369 RepID=A0A0M2H8Z9_9MICO|nr:VanZ family protein [Microbacterium terrae]KJL40475.1 VanZ like family protein [Microbacterium terrae]MBP1079200.1 glycopeptide antibiotics resistance protein [Microbacterium terrae]GLJ98600.1 hypothetical protein GCM10017594_17970 [Microbacterium terrae]